MVLELHIPKDAQLEVKVRKLAAGVHKEKSDISQVQFQLNMKITKLQLDM